MAREGRACEKMAIYKPTRESSKETNPVDILVFTFQPPELQENKLLLFKQPSLFMFIMAGLAN
jgi:hypothetical protein